ncbi:hypothetical protein, partial [Salmonella enterica]|uniref:hypothetical protein n=1 Tax=Salmonella enterica TaxID=28901 RepID=UPI003296B1B0
MWRQHGRSGTDGELVTELEAGDPPVQLVVEDDGWLLLRLLDGAQGWIEPASAQLEASDAPNADELADPAHLRADAFIDVLTSFEGVPYVWG